MKICKFEYDNLEHWGEVINQIISPLNDFDNPFQQNNQRNNQTVFPEDLNIEAVKFLPLTPSKIICVGRNYAEHAAELGNDVPSEPLLFLKAPSSIICQNEAIKIPTQSNQVEHEGELAIVIGRTCKDLPDEGNPLKFVFGYTCLNDVTARDLQRADVQFTRAKSFDTFCPISTIIETELDISDIRVLTRVNGVIKQDGRTSQMVFPVPFLIRYISRQMTLNAGDVIATGTPSGVSKLSAGDVCEVEIEGVGVLRNLVEQL